LTSVKHGQKGNQDLDRFGADQLNFISPIRYFFKPGIFGADSMGRLALDTNLVGYLLPTWPLVTEETTGRPMIPSDVNRC